MAQFILFISILLLLSHRLSLFYRIFICSDCTCTNSLCLLSLRVSTQSVTILNLQTVTLAPSQYCLQPIDFNSNTDFTVTEKSFFFFGSNDTP